VKRSRKRTRPTLSRRRLVGLGLALPAAAAVGLFTREVGTLAQTAAPATPLETPTPWSAWLPFIGAVAQTPPATATPAATATPTLSLYPEETEGPYYVDLNVVRQDITEGKAGQALRLVLQAVQLPAGTPIAGSAVDVWHADALGVYSDEAALGTQGRTFLRGTQVTDSTGAVQFQTIFPGWYRGRTIHIHLKVHASSRTFTSQLYFPEDLNNTVMATAPYRSRPNRDTTNATDSVYNQGTKPPLTAVTQEGGVYVARMTLGIA
jgi:protocatechuate 3,4-dioxygenase beta subunit